MDEHRQAWTIAIEKEHEDDAQGQFKDTATDLRAARQQPVADLSQVGLDRQHQRRTLLVDAVPESHQPLADQGHTTQPRRRFGQAIDLHILEQRGCVAHMVHQVEPQPHQRHRHQHHPAQRQHARREGFTTIEPAGQKTHQRPTGERQHRAPEQRRPEGRHHPEAGTEQHQKQDLHQ
ncbi:hypothetical protein D3C80_1273800 [compost metagenome]